MNPKHNQPSSLSQADIDLLSHLTDLAETLEPNPAFESDLEAELLQLHPSNSPQNTDRRANRMTVGFPQFNRRASLVAGTSIAIIAALMIPAFASRRATDWLTAVFNLTVNSKANAQTIAQAIETGQITVNSDVQEYDKTTQKLRAIGNAVFVYPEARIRANANEIQYTATARQVTLLGNVQISQPGETLRGRQATCSLEQKQCRLTQE